MGIRMMLSACTSKLVYPKDLREMVNKAASKQKKKLFRKRCDLFVLNEGALFHMPTEKKPGAAREVPRACDIDRILRAFHENSVGFRAFEPGYWILGTRVYSDGVRSLAASISTGCGVGSCSVSFSFFAFA